MTDYELPPADALPAAMVTRSQWLCWRAEDRDGKQTKVPIDPTSGRYASTTDPETWTDFATARDYPELEDIGLGFVFTDDDPLVGVDLDDCRNPDTGTLTDWAEDIVNRLDSFTEVSPSGTGVHVIVKGRLPEGRNRHGDVELYETARFFTVTGDRLESTPKTVAAREDALSAVHATYLSPTESQERSNTAAETGTDRDGSQPQRGGNDLGDDELLEKARRAANGEKFERLYRGNTAGYESQSEADMALCSLLAFWTGGDSQQMDRLFRASGLMREKWDEAHFSDGATYGERTIERAIAGTAEFYGGGQGWRMFPDQDLRETTGVSDTPVNATGEMSSSDSVEQLVATVQQLEAENEQLQDELEAERTRRKALEAEIVDSRETGIIDWLRRQIG